MDNEKKFISGIFNYCDRWCEKCIFTKKCVVYDQVEEHEKDGSSVDLNSFFENLKKILQNTHNLLQEKLKEFYPEGIPNDVVKNAEQSSAEIEDKVENDSLNLSAKKYSSMVSDWLEENEELNIVSDNINEDNACAEEYLHGGLIKDVSEIIMFYHYFIEIKIKRALFDKYEFAKGDNDFRDAILTTQKLAILAITRSLASWEILYEQLGHKNNILPIIAVLEKLKANMEEIFPEAITFKRPYFD